jgi:hypothetical protein
MRLPSIARTGVIALFVLGALATLSADTLFLRDGRRVSGELLTVRNGVIEFQEYGSRNARILRIPRDEVRRIELDESIDDRYVPERQEAGRPRGLRERDVTVSGDVPWNDTGVDVRAGQLVYFTARGTVWWGPGRKDGPAGEKNSPHNPSRPIPNRPAASLIGKIGSASDDLFFIGDDEEPLRMRASGRLFLGVNDDVLGDNRGNFRVVVAY